MDDDELADRARRLLVVRPEDFVSERAGSVRELRDRADRDGAKAVGALRKPAPAAWVVNLLAAQGVLDEAVDLGPALRRAQEDADPGEIRTLRARRRALVESLGDTGSDLAAGAGHPVTAAVDAQVAATIEAAMADPRAAAAVRSGLLVRALESVGFEPVDLEGAVAVPGVVPEASEMPDPGPDAEPADAHRASRPRSGTHTTKPATTAAARESEPAPDPEADTRARDAARDAVVAADAALDDLDARIDEAEHRRRDLDDRRQELERQLREVRRALTDAVRDREWLDGEHAAAERASDDARSALSRVERGRDRRPGRRPRG